MRESRLHPIVQASGAQKHSRAGKGFSLEELREAGLSVDRAKRLGIHVDRRRKTVYAENSRKLKLEYVVAFPLTEIRGIGKSGERELVRAGVFDARDLAETGIDVLSTRVKYSKSRLQKWQAEAKTMVEKKLSRL